MKGRYDAAKHGLAIEWESAIAIERKRQCADKDPFGRSSRRAAAGQLERLRATVSLAESEAKHMRARMERAERLAAQAHKPYDMARAEAKAAGRAGPRVAAADGAGPQG